MKFRYSIVIIFLLLASCSGITSLDKRHFRNGFYIQRNHHADKNTSSVSSENIPKNQEFQNLDETKGNHTDTTTVSDSAKTQNFNSQTGQTISAKDTSINSQKIRFTPRETFSPVSKWQQKAKNQSTAWYIFAVLFLIAAIISALLLVFLDFAAFPLGGAIAIVLLAGGLIFEVLLSITFVIIGRNKKLHPTEEKKSTEEPSKNPQEQLKSKIKNAFIFDLVGILIPLLVIGGIIYGFQALRIMKKNNIEDKKSRRKAIGAILLAFHIVLLDILIGVVSS